MKLRLSQQDNITILDILEDVSLANVPVLKAGITKLIHSGKRLLIINILHAQKLIPTCMVELLKFDSIGTEVKSHIVLVGQFDIVKEAYKLFSTPPTMKCYPTIDAGISAIKEAQAPFKAGTQIVAPGISQVELENLSKDELQAEISKYEAINSKKKEKLGKVDFKEIHRLRIENTQLKHKNKSMEEHISFLSKKRPKPYEDEPDLLEKINELETVFETFLKKVQLLGN